MTKFVCLVENTSSSPLYGAKHGLSIYIETGRHKLLFDLGQDDLFLKNAEKLGVDIAAVDTVIISHGHYDHAGALDAFLNVNTRAKIYIRKSAFGEYFTVSSGSPRYIGLDGSLSSDPRLIFTDEFHVIDEELTLFSGVTGRKFRSSANDTLYARIGGEMVPDPFVHEQYLVISDEDRQILLTGCSHAGIVNIAEAYGARFKTGAPHSVIGGFHLYNNARNTCESDDRIAALADRLMQTSCRYYTCHCTGEYAYRLMKEHMGDKLGYFAVGDQLSL